jgi:hypothetical protein
MSYMSGPPCQAEHRYATPSSRGVSQGTGIKASYKFYRPGSELDSLQPCANQGGACVIPVACITQLRTGPQATQAPQLLSDQERASSCLCARLQIAEMDIEASIDPGPVISAGDLRSDNARGRRDRQAEQSQRSQLTSQIVSRS